MSERTQTAARPAHQIATCRTFAVAAVQAIALTSASLDEIGAKIGKDGKHLRRCLMRLIEGRALDLSDFSDICYACGCEADFNVHPHVELPRQEQTP